LGCKVFRLLWAAVDINTGDVSRLNATVPANHMHTTLQSTFELAHSTATGKDLSLDHKPVVTYTQSYWFNECHEVTDRRNIRTKALCDIEGFLGCFCSNAFGCWDAILSQNLI
jgi:hypothetical protein